VNPSIAQRLASVVAVVATPCVAIAIAVMLFLNPLWVAFDQNRSDVSGLTGYTPAQVQAVTGGVLSDLVFGPPSFAVSLTPGGPPILDERERSHMTDVRTVILDLGLVALVAAVLLVGVGAASRGRRWFWRSVALGARILAVGVVVVGIGFALFFDQAFQTFHEIFFPAGTYTFDPRTEKLVQLFPDQFWTETSIAISLAILVLALAIMAGATRLGREPEPANGARVGPWAP
jgi:integral membrane protein (TIGR01906 family)